MKDAFYFPHDANARHDPKICAMMCEYGMRGYGMYWVLVEMMREQADYRLRLNGPFSTRVYARELDCEPEFAEQFISGCIRPEEEDGFGLFESDGKHFWSNSLIRRMEKKDDLRDKRAAAGRKGGKTRVRRMQVAKAKGSHAKKEWEEMVKFFDNKCVRCGGTPKDGPTKDHIIPVYQGGSDGVENLQPLCQRCNSSMGSEVIDFRQAFCEANAKQMPSKWQAVEEKRREEKRREEKKEYATGVALTPEEHKKLVELVGERNTKMCITKLSDYKGAKGKRYASDYRAIRNWVIKEITGKEPQDWEESKQAVPKCHKCGHSLANEMKNDASSCYSCGADITEEKPWDVPP